jgi:hypothetical protein
MRSYLSVYALFVQFTFSAKRRTMVAPNHATNVLKSSSGHRMVIGQ